MRIVHVGRDFPALRLCGLTLYSDALMRAQAAAGHDVTYFFAGRHYPLMKRSRTHRWQNGSVQMVEFMASPINSHWEFGTRRPERDTEEPEGLAAFAEAVERAQPDVVHIHELAGLPSSIIDFAKDRDIAVVMTLHDYSTICASVRLIDADGRRCSRARVADSCARACSRAPDDHKHVVEATVGYELKRMKTAVPAVRKLDFRRLGPIFRLLLGTRDAKPAAAPVEADCPPAAAYQRRRETNLRRLGRCDRLVAGSERVVEIFSELGLDPDQFTVQRLTLPHLETLSPGVDDKPQRPLTFVTLGGCTHATKGSRVIAEAVERLVADGRGDDFRLLVLGAAERNVRERLQSPTVFFGPDRYDDRDVDTWLDHAHVGIMPSVWEETFGFVGIEMLAKGVPIIGNALGGIPEYVVENRTGWLNHSSDAAGLANVMSHLIDNPGEVTRLTQSTRAARDEFVTPMSDHVAEVQQLYTEVVARQRVLEHAA